MSPDRTANEIEEEQGGTRQNRADLTKEGAKGSQNDATPVTPALQLPDSNGQQTPFRSVEVTEALNNSKRWE